MKRCVCFEFDIDEIITIRELGINGRVIALLANNHGREYQVVYYRDNERHCDWLHEWELDYAKPPAAMGL